MQSPELKGVGETNRSEQVRGAQVSRRAPQPDQNLGPALKLVQAIKVLVKQSAAPGVTLLRITHNRILIGLDYGATGVASRISTLVSTGILNSLFGDKDGVMATGSVCFDDFWMDILEGGSWWKDTSAWP